MTKGFIYGDKDVNLFYKQIPNPKGVIVICPGGGYTHLSPRESEPVAAAFRSVGWQAFVLNYSVGENLGKKPLQELAEAVREIRLHEKEMNLEGKPVVVCGFSAGGHLAASLGVHWDDRTMFGSNTMHRPDGLVLCYPVITAGKYGHQKSIEALVGRGDASYFSLEHYITKNTPPTFLWHTMTDKTVSVQNTILFAQGLANYGISAEVHLYPYGVHGLSLATDAVAEPEKARLPDAHVAQWFEQCTEWLTTIKKIKE